MISKQKKHLEIYEGKLLNEHLNLVNSKYMDLTMYLNKAENCNVIFLKRNLAYIIMKCLIQFKYVQQSSGFVASSCHIQHLFIKFSIQIMISVFKIYKTNSNKINKKCIEGKKKIQVIIYCDI